MQKKKKVALRDHASFVCTMEAQGVTLFDHSWEHKHLTTRSLLHSVQGMSVNDSKSTTSIDFRVTNKFNWVGKFTNMISVNHEDQLYIMVTLVTTWQKLLGLFMDRKNRSSGRISERGRKIWSFDKVLLKRINVQNQLKGITRGQRDWICCRFYFTLESLKPRILTKYWISQWIF